MKKLLTAMALACAAMAASAEDSFLYWMVDVGASTDYAFNYATIKAKDASGNTSDYLWLYGQDSADKIGQRFYASNYGENGSYAPGTTTGGGAFAGLGDYGLGSQFLFELWTDGATADSPNCVGWTGWLDYDKIAGSIFSAGSLSGSSPFTVGSAMLVPEPSGGLLALMGLAVLALRRRRNVA